MDESTKILVEVRDLLKRAEERAAVDRRAIEDRLAEDRRVARMVSMQPRSWFERLCSLVSLLCMLLALAQGYMAFEAHRVSGYWSIALAAGAAVLLVGGVVASWCGRNADRSPS